MIGWILKTLWRYKLWAYMTQWFGERRIKESTIIIRILRKEVWSFSMPLHRLGILPGNLIVWLSRNCLSIQWVSQTRLVASGDEWEITLERLSTTWDCNFMCTKWSFARRTKETHRKPEVQKKRKKEPQIRWGSLAWGSEVRGKGLCNKQNIIMFQNKLRIAH